MQRRDYLSWGVTRQRKTNKPTRGVWVRTRKKCGGYRVIKLWRSTVRPGCGEESRAPLTDGA